MNRIDRLFAILLLIQCKRRMRALDLAQAFEISERTINRDMATERRADHGAARRRV